MKKILLLLSIFLCSIGYSQNFNGNYKSFKTSYQDYSSSKNNFIEETEFNLKVFINKNKDGGRIEIQDPRIPKKLLIYKVINYLGVLTSDGITNYLYKCTTEHLDRPIETTLVFYYPIDKKLSLMVHTEKSSQAFFDLVKQ